MIPINTKHKRKVNSSDAVHKVHACLKVEVLHAEQSGARQVFELGAAEEGAEELGAVGEVDVADALCAVLVVPLPQLRVAQHLRRTAASSVR